MSVRDAAHEIAVVEPIAHKQAERNVEDIQPDNPNIRPGTSPPFELSRLTPNPPWVECRPRHQLRTLRLRGIFPCASMGSFADLGNDKLPICN